MGTFFATVPTPTAYSQSSLDQELTEPPPQTWRTSSMFVLVFPIKTGAPDAEAQDSFPS